MSFDYSYVSDYVDYSIFSLLFIMLFIVTYSSIERVIFLKRVNIYDYKNIRLLDKDLTNNTTILYTIAVNAPYIGLLGTVIGILTTFYTISTQETINIQEVILGLSIALKATAFGIGVAIPATISYNIITRAVSVRKAEWHSINELKN